MNKTRKIRNKKLFLKWLKKSHRNKYNIVHGGAGDDDDKNKGKGQEITTMEKPSFVARTFTRENAVLLAGAVTLGEVAFTLASNPVVISAVVSLGIGTAAFTGIISGGATLVLILVATYAFVKIRALYSNYYTMIYVMNDYILLLKKIDTMVRLSIKISQEYKFVIDTKDVNKSLERIFSKFDRLLSDEDVSEINKEVLDNRGYDKITEQAAEIENDDDNTLAEQASLLGDETSEEKEIVVSDRVKKRQDNIFKRFGKKIASSAKSIGKSARKFGKVISLNSKEFTEELNEEVMRLGLYFSILLGELNIVLNVCQMDIIGKGDKQALITKNNNVKSDGNFNNLLISSIIYRTLQLYNIFNLCGALPSRSKTAKKTCSDANIEEYIKEIEFEREKIRKILLGKTTSDGKTLFPLYEQLSNSRDTNTPNGLQNLRFIMKGFEASITTKSQAVEFMDAIHTFNTDYSKKISKSASSSITSTDYTTQEGYSNANTAVNPAVSNPTKIPPPRIPISNIPIEKVGGEYEENYKGNNPL
jgi:hypothetical protein